MTQIVKARWVYAIVLVGLVMALLYHGYVGHVLGAGYPSNTFLYDPSKRFLDFFDVFGPVVRGAPLSNLACPYFPFAFVPLYALARIAPDAALAVTLGIFVATTLWFFWRRLAFLVGAERLSATLILVVATYPFLICIDRANLEVVVFALLLGFMAAFGRERYLAAAALLACATAMKLYPGAFGVLLLVRRQYRASALTAGLTLILTLLPAATFPGGLTQTFHLTMRNIAYFTEHVALDRSSIPVSSGYFSILKLVVLAVGGDVTEVARRLRPAYFIFCFGLFATVTAYILAVERTLWRQVALLALAVILLPDVSYDYRLIYLLIPLILFLVAPAQRTREDVAVAVVFGLLLIPKSYAGIGGLITLGVVINPLLMTLLAGWIMVSGWRARPAARATAH